MRPCPVHGCGELTEGGRCQTHKRSAELARGTRQERGYDSHHDVLRRFWQPRVAAGTVTCARCGTPIAPAASWDLGHTDNRQAWTGPEHATCNRAAGGRAAHPTL